jgi:benzoyl-CoA reductase/2-hydroxyglutaryl-CoA dehydratase subunit BcrC/BadD/HgdB
MSNCCGNGHKAELSPEPFAWFEKMIDNCYAYATAAHAEGRPIVGMMCEFTPRELIMAAGGVPVLLCGGSAKMIAPAEEELPANLCPLIKSTYGYHLKGNNPFLEMASLIVAETTCDGKKKMYELMAATRPMCVLELPQKPDDPDAFDHWLREIEKLKETLETRFAVTITEEKLCDAIRTMNRERRLRRELAASMQSPCPPLTGRQLLDLKSSISGLEEDLRQYKAAIKLLGETAGDSERANCVRVLMTGVPMPHGAERVLNIIEEHGGPGIKPLLDDVDEDAADPLRALAEKYFHLPCSVMTRNDRRMMLLRQLTAEYRPHCIVELVWQACLTYDIESIQVRRLAEELGLPYLRIETDYSPSDSERIAIRVEALFETVRGEAGHKHHVTVSAIDFHA